MTQNNIKLSRFIISSWSTMPLFSSISGLILTFNSNALLSRNTCDSLVVWAVVKKIVVDNTLSLCVFVVLEHIVLDANDREILTFICIKIVGRTVFDLQGDKFFVSIDSIKHDVSEVIEYAYWRRNWFHLNLRHYYTSWDFTQPMRAIQWGSFFMWMPRLVNSKIGFNRYSYASDESDDIAVRPKQYLPTLKELWYLRRGWPFSQFRFSANFYDPKFGSIGRIVNVIDSDVRIVRVELRFTIDPKSVGLSLLLEVPVNLLICEGRVYGTGVNKKVLNVPVTRVSNISSINGVSSFNIIVPQNIYFISRKPTKALGHFGAVSVPTHFTIDLYKLISLVPNKFNIFKRKCALLNIVYRNDVVSGRGQSWKAKLFNNSDQIEEENHSDLGQMRNLQFFRDRKKKPKSLTCFQNQVKKAQDGRKHRYNKNTDKQVVVLNKNVFTNEVLSIVLMLKWWLLIVKIFDKSGNFITMLYRSMGTRFLGNFIHKGLMSRTKGASVEITEILVIDPNLVEKYVTEDVVGKLNDMLIGDRGRRPQDDKRIFAFIYNSSDGRTTGAKIYNKSKEGLISFTNEQIKQIIDFIELK